MNRRITELFPPMYAGKELDDLLSLFPQYDTGVQNKSKTERLVALQDIYNIYIPTCMSREIYSKLYLSLIRSLQKKNTYVSTRQYGENSKLIHQKGYESIIGGADSFTIIGESGLGKSSGISRAITVLTKNPIIECNNTSIINCVLVQCPADCSVKGMLLEILRKADEFLKSKYYDNAIRAKSTVDVLVGTVSQVALNHIGLLIIDEIQNIVHKNGKAMIGTLTQLINNSGVSIGMVGTPESEPFFSSEMVLARRSVGLSYKNSEFGEQYKSFVRTLLDYNYTANPINVDEALYMWLYSHSGGNTAITVQLIHDAQEIAILTDSEQLDIASLNQAFERRMKFLHEYIEFGRKRCPNFKKNIFNIKEINENEELSVKISDISAQSKKKGLDVVEKLIETGINILEIHI